MPANRRFCKYFSMAVGAPSLLLRALALASTLPILKLHALLTMDSNPAFSPPVQMRRGRPAAEAPPMYFLVSALTCKKTFPVLEFKSTTHALCSLDNSPSVCSDLVNKKLSHFLDKFVLKCLAL
jgi:hypothetical protein